MFWAGDQGAAFRGTLPWQLPGETEDRGTRQARRDGHGGLVLGGGLEGPSVVGTGADHCSGGIRRRCAWLDWYIRVNT